ncbi:SDR family oxidoreductase [Acidithiobacillus sp.]|uniref:SDR family NAD(P)-dependent oxidoreductase n=1 Tax=Acidithiobacillus sp. TaxID=1872118 RepID=UPI0025C39D37|nr:SDR family NAD(P)-dependent oxidoreductase [Acidithiobacillus sp.]
MSSPSFWRGKRCWLVGASSGIGAACARELARAGAQLAISARSQDSLDALRTEFSQGAQDPAPNAHLAVAMDVRSDESVAVAWERIREAWGGIDLLLYLAGNYVPARSWELDVGRARDILDINYLGALRTVSCVLPSFLEAGAGHIALTSSVAGLRGLPKSLYYGPSKAALTHFAEILRLDLEPRGLRVQVIHPGFVATPLTAQNDFAMPHLLQPEAAAQLLLRGLEGRSFEIHFPKAFTRRFHWLRCLPYSWYFPLIRRATGL